jgi:phosphatidylethanolamine/phosphatidyl-N-methylethanolamine N-methyltransferase
MEKVYDVCSSFYDVVFGRVFRKGRLMAPGLLDMAPDQHVLEVGVGTGLSIPHLPPEVQFTGIDLSEKMLNRAKERVAQMGRNSIQLLQMDATHLDFPDNTFDHVLAAYFISTVPDPVRCVEEMKRVCKPGGHLVFVNHFKSTNKFIGAVDELFSPLCYRIGFHMNLDLHKLLADTGLEAETLKRVDFRGQWKAVRCINP